MKNRIFWLVVLALVIVIQIIPVDRPEIKAINEKDLIINNQLPDSIVQILKKACYDCHSNQTIYPWYSYVAPVSWLVVRDVKEGKRHLNFSEWESLDKVKKAEYLNDISDEVSDGTMPLVIYPIMHHDAKLTQEERQVIVDWTNNFGEALFESN